MPRLVLMEKDDKKTIILEGVVAVIVVTVITIFITMAVIRHEPNKTAKSDVSPLVTLGMNYGR